MSNIAIFANVRHNNRPTDLQEVLECCRGTKFRDGKDHWVVKFESYDDALRFQSEATRKLFLVEIVPSSLNTQVYLVVYGIPDVYNMGPWIRYRAEDSYCAKCIYYGEYIVLQISFILLSDFRESLRRDICTHLAYKVYANEPSVYAMEELLQE